MATAGVSPEAAGLLDGKALSKSVLAELQGRIEHEHLQPHLHVINVGDDPASQVYVKQKRLAAEKIGVRFSQTSLPSDAALPELLKVISARNSDHDTHGIIVQLPLPGGLREHERQVLEHIEPAKDVDCFHPVNFGQLALGTPVFLPATPAGVLRLIKHYGIQTRGKRCVILGKSNIVGKPLALLLAQEDGPAATVFLCDQYTEGIWELTRQADILIVAAGKHHLISDPSVLRADGQVAIIDIGIHRVQTSSGKWVVQGDVDMSAVQNHCQWITPVPGGAGPMTVACLLEQVVEAASRLGKNDPSCTYVEQIIQTAFPKDNGQLTSGELLRLLAKLDPTCVTEQLRQAITSMAGDEEHINLQEFVRWAFGQDKS